MAGWHHGLNGLVWVNSGRWWWTGRPGVLQFMGSQRARHDWGTELNWNELYTSWINLRKILYQLLLKIRNYPLRPVLCQGWEKSLYGQEESFSSLISLKIGAWDLSLWHPLLQLQGHKWSQVFLTSPVSDFLFCHLLLLVTHIIRFTQANNPV